MAFIATHSAPGAHHSLLGRVFSGFGAFVLRLAEARSRNDQYEQLKKLSDADLARLGLTRDGIVRRVFSDSLYL